MNRSCRRFVVPSLAVAGLLVLGSQAGAASQTTPLWPDFGLHPQAPSLTRQWHGVLPLVRGRAGRPAVSTYTIDDVGAPDPSTYASSQPQAFDNNGLMVGYGSTTTRLECVVYNGKFVTPKMPADFTTCNVTSISDRLDLGKGKYEFVGLAGTQYGENVSVFSAIGGPSQKPEINLLPRFQPSVLNGVNDSGKAIGDSHYSPPGGYFSDQPPFALRGGRKPENFKPLQETQCLTLVRYCMSFNSQADAVQFACGFGGCTINDNNVVLGEDGFQLFGNDLSIGQPVGRHGPAVRAVHRRNGHRPASTTPDRSRSQSSVGIYLPFHLHGRSIGAGRTWRTAGTELRRVLPRLSENNKGEVLGIALMSSDRYRLLDLGLGQRHKAKPSRRPGLARIAVPWVRALRRQRQWEYPRCLGSHVGAEPLGYARPGRRPQAPRLAAAPLWRPAHGSADVTR